MSMKVLSIWWYYFLVVFRDCDCVKLVPEQWGDSQSLRARKTALPGNASVPLMTSTIICSKLPDQPRRQPDFQSDVSKITDVENNLDASTLGRIYSFLDMAESSKQDAQFFCHEIMPKNVSLFMEIENETREDIHVGHFEGLPILNGTETNVLRKLNLTFLNSIDKEIKKYSCRLLKNDVLSDLDITTNYSLIPVRQHYNARELKSMKCCMNVTIYCDQNIKDCFSIIFLYDIQTCLKSLDNILSDKPLTFTLSVIACLTLVFLVIKSLAKAGASVLQKSNNIVWTDYGELRGRPVTTFKGGERSKHSGGGEQMGLLNNADFSAHTPDIHVQVQV